MRTLLSGIIFGLLYSAPVLAQGSCPDAWRPYQPLSGDMASVEAQGVSFQIPAEWQERYTRCGDNFYLSPEEMTPLRKVGGQWDPEFTAVMNTVLPFENVLLQVGSEPFPGTFYNDVSVRVYLTDLSAAQIRTRLLTAGKARVDSIQETQMHNAPPYFPRIVIDSTQAGAWTKTQLIFTLWFQHYGGTGHVALYSRPCGDQTVVVAFLHGSDRWRESDLIPTILDSFRCGAAGEIGDQMLDRRVYAASPDTALFAAVVQAILSPAELPLLSVDPHPLSPEDNPAVENARIFANVPPQLLAGRTEVLRRLRVESGAAHKPPRCAGPRDPEADGGRTTTCPPEGGRYTTAVLGLPRPLPDDGTGAERVVVRVVERRFAPDGASILTTWDYQMRRELRSTEWKLVNKLPVPGSD